MLTNGPRRVKPSRAAAPSSAPTTAATQVLNSTSVTRSPASRSSTAPRSRRSPRCASAAPPRSLATAHTQQALVALLRLTSSAGVPLHLLGLGSNVLYPDQGLGGVVARLGGVFSRTRLLPGDRLRAGGAVPLPRLARSTASRGLLGLEAFSGFPVERRRRGGDERGLLRRRDQGRAGSSHRAPSRRQPAALPRRRDRGVVSQDGAAGRRRGGGQRDVPASPRRRRHRARPHRRAQPQALGEPALGPTQRGLDLPQPRGRPRRPADRGRRPQGPAARAERRSARSTPTSSSTSAARAPTTCWR